MIENHMIVTYPLRPIKPRRFVPEQAPAGPPASTERANMTGSLDQKPKD